jgi:hypothetical protein
MLNRIGGIPLARSVTFAALTALVMFALASIRLVSVYADTTDRTVDSQANVASGAENSTANDHCRLAGRVVHKLHKRLLKLTKSMPGNDPTDDGTSSDPEDDDDASDDLNCEDSGDPPILLFCPRVSLRCVEVDACLTRLQIQASSPLFLALQRLRC